MIGISACTGDDAVGCPGCSMLSKRVHSRYERRLSDTAVGGHEVMIRLRVRRLFCDNHDCGRKTFAEQVPNLAGRHARRTTILQRVLCAVALALGGRPGARLTRHLAAAVSRMTLLRQIRALPDPDRPTPAVLGVDDFALRRGHHYGTILIDMQTRRPVDVLPDRTSETLATWLEAHPGIEIVCRDRAGAYAEAARLGAPNAVQVADRWHLWHNLGEAVERAVATHHRYLAAAIADELEPPVPPRTDSAPVPSQTPPGPAARTDRTAVRTRQRYKAVHRLLAEGRSIRGIATDLGLARGTARRFARAASPEELLVNNRTGYRRSLLEDHKPYLHQRWNEGCTNAAHLFIEIKTRGYRGSDKILRKYLHQFRTGDQIAWTPPKPPTARRVTAWIMTDPANLEPDHQKQLETILAASPDLKSLVDHVRGFADIMRNRRGRELEKWMAAIDADDQPSLHSFVRGLRRDQDAVAAGLTMEWNSGAVEGHVNRIKMLKRQMFGRANLDLLRKRILLRD
ncbi:ISL3 family transposase [Nocardia sp. NPDC052278]|uniref:ISL3 family transposase n=1 Tax=unclassified Nocardia TaxID=2637762 RepID=UPI00369B5D06